jgi:hypothetical protein
MLKRIRMFINAQMKKICRKVCRAVFPWQYNYGEKYAQSHATVRLWEMSREVRLAAEDRFLRTWKRQQWIRTAFPKASAWVIRKSELIYVLGESGQKAPIRTTGLNPLW